MWKGTILIMPYITEDRRGEVKNGCKTPGELNYCLTLLCIDYANRHGHCYTTYNEIIGALECAKMEFYRRLAVPYEDQKIEENGDVYP